jgi:hypothetical protein
MESFQRPSGVEGAPLASKIGHFFVRVCPGGIRFARLVSGLIMTPAGASVGETIRFCWVLFWSMANIGEKFKRMRD